MYTLLLLAACNDGGLKHVNATPTATITWPTDGDTLNSGDVTLTGTVGDGDDDVESLTVRWTVDGGERCAGAEDSGDTSCVASLDAGEHTIVLAVSDPDGASDTSTVTVTVATGSAPVVTILSPSADDALRVGDAVTFSGRVTDAEDAPGDLLVEWQDGDGAVLDIPCAPDATGLCETETTLETAGSQTFCLVATDVSGNVSTQCVVVDVSEANHAPECVIVAPADGAFAAVDTDVSLDATVSDVEGDVLDVAWSDNGLVLATGVVTGAGELAATARFTAGNHVLTFSAIDPEGASCSASVTVHVGDAPIVTIESPTDGDIYGETQSVVLSAVVVDNEDLPNTLALQWSSDVDGVLDTGSSDASGNVYVVIPALTPGPHHLTLSALDSDGLTSSASVDIEVDQAPSAPRVSISPASPGTDADLVVTIVTPSVDPEGDAITYGYAWYRGGVYSSASTTATLPASATTRGEAWSVEVVANDGFADSLAGTASATIVNTVPSVSGVAITPDPADESDLLTCSWSFSDADGDSDTSDVSWTVNGAVAGTTATLAGAFVGGDVVICTVTPSDGIDVGTSGSDTDVIGNSGPSVTSLTLSPSSPQTNDLLTAAATGSDPDGGALSTTWGWTVNGAAVSETGDTLDGAAWFSRGDTVGVTVTISDGLSSAADSTSVTVRNTAPTLTSASVSPDPAHAGDTLTCVTVGYADADYDPQAASYSWTVNGVAAGTSSTLTSGIVGGDVVVCTATATDGTDVSPSRTDSLTVTNTLPVVSSVSLSPSSPTTDSTITASASALDVDGDSVTLAYAWTVNGLAVSPTTSTLAGTWFSKHDVVRVSVTPNDGSGSGTALVSSPVPVINTSPVAPVVSVPDGPIEGLDDLVCSIDVGSTDADGDSVSYSATWTDDGVAFTGATTTSFLHDTVPAASTTGTEEWVCTVTPNDGEANGATASASVDVWGEPVDYGHVQYPCTMSLAAGSPGTVYGWVYMVGITDAVGRGTPIEAEVGYGPNASLPMIDAGWVWSTASYNTDTDAYYPGDHANDEYVGTVTAPSATGAYDYAFRFTTDGGLSWVYADLGGTTCALLGTTDGYQSATAGVLTVY